MKPADLLTTIFHHNLWANIRLLERCSELSDAELDATLVGTYGSIRDTLQHIIWSELSLYTRIKTGQPYRRPEDSPKPTLPELLESAWTTGAGLIEEAGLAQVGDTVQVDRDGVPRDMPKMYHPHPGDQSRYRTPGSDPGYFNPIRDRASRFGQLDFFQGRGFREQVLIRSYPGSLPGRNSCLVFRIS